MLEPQSDPSATPLVFRAPLFRVQRGLRVDFASRKPFAKPSVNFENTPKAAWALAMGHRFLQAVEQGEVQDFAALALKLNVSRAWVSMSVELTFLAPRIQEAILLGNSRLPSIQDLVQIARLRNWNDQLNRWKGMKRWPDSPPEIRGK